jgi:predicted TIM-barrel fold metal-dependent hydrolase
MPMIIDFRIRPPYKSFLDSWIFRTRDPNPSPVTISPLHIGLERYRSFEERSMKYFMEEMDEAGIDKAVIMGRQSAPQYGSVPNSEVAELTREYPDRFIGFGGVNGSDTAVAMEEIKKIVDYGFKGIAMDNGWSAPPLYDDDERLFPIYEKCTELGLILSLTSSIFVGPDLSYSMPAHIQRVAIAFPKLDIVVPHAGWPWTTQMCAVAFQSRNVNLVPDFYLNVPHTPGAEEYMHAVNYYLQHRLLYASSYPVRPLKQSVEQFKALNFEKDETRQLCLGKNAARLLKLA